MVEQLTNLKSLASSTDTAEQRKYGREQIQLLMDQINKEIAAVSEDLMRTKRGVSLADGKLHKKRVKQLEEETRGLTYKLTRFNQSNVAT